MNGPLRVSMPTDEFHALGGWFDHRAATYHFPARLIAELQARLEKKVEAEVAERMDLLRIRERHVWRIGLTSGSSPS